MANTDPDDQSLSNPRALEDYKFQLNVALERQKLDNSVALENHKAQVALASAKELDLLKAKTGAISDFNKGQWSFQLASEKNSADFAIFILRSAIFVNGAGVALLMSFMTSLAKDGALVDSFVYPILVFAGGIVISLIAASFGFLSFYTRQKLHALDGGKEVEAAKLHLKILRINAAGIILAFFSILLFVGGVSLSFDPIASINRANAAEKAEQQPVTAPTETSK